MKKTSVVLPLFLIGGITVACGGGDGGGSLTPAAAIDEQVDLLCGAAFECMSSFPTDKGVTHAQLFGANEAACQTMFDGLFDADAVQASVDAGRIEYDAADAAACNDAFDALSCDDLWLVVFDDPAAPPEPAACDTAFVGTIADGGACTIDQDCEADASGCGSDNTCAPQ
jgi:hypothetical protein